MVITLNNVELSPMSAVSIPLGVDLDNCLYDVVAFQPTGEQVTLGRGVSSGLACQTVNNVNEHPSAYHAGYLGSQREDIRMLRAAFNMPRNSMAFVKYKYDDACQDN